MSDQPKILNPEEASRAHEILARPHGVPFGHTDVSEVRRRETPEPTPNALPAELCWFFPAMAYTMVGVDKSLFELFHWNIGHDIRPRTYVCQDAPLVEIEGTDVRTNKWFYTLQGLDMEYASAFVNFVASFMFRKGGYTWSLDCVETRIRDPFSAAPRGVDCFLLLPRLHSPAKRMYVKQEAGLLLGTPILAVTNDTPEVPVQPTT